MKRIMRMLAVAGLVIAAGGATVTQATASPSPSPVSAQEALHPITCTESIGHASKPSKYLVHVTGTRTCSDEPDISNVTVWLQVYVDKVWYDLDVGTTSSSTAKKVSVTDQHGIRAGCWHYRGHLYVEEFHGTWGSWEGYTNGDDTLCR